MNVYVTNMNHIYNAADDSDGACDNGDAVKNDHVSCMQVPRVNTLSELENILLVKEKVHKYLFLLWVGRSAKKNPSQRTSEVLTRDPTLHEQGITTEEERNPTFHVSV